MDEELPVAEQIASLLRGPHGVVWDLVKTTTRLGLPAPPGWPTSGTAGEQVVDPLRANGVP